MRQKHLSGSLRGCLNSSSNVEIGELRQPLRGWPAQRQVFHQDSLEWARIHPARENTSIVTSLPDLSELPELGFEGWRSWFQGAFEQFMDWLPDNGLGIFYQSDIRYGGLWIDKGFLLQSIAERRGYFFVWHKIVCRKPPGTITPGRASFAHLLCWSKQKPKAIVRPGPDVLLSGGVPSWRRGMGIEACRLACRFLRDESSTQTVLDPFCGEGAVLSAANFYGFHAIGIEINRKRCETARSFV